MGEVKWDDPEILRGIFSDLSAPKYCVLLFFSSAKILLQMYIIIQNSLLKNFIALGALVLCVNPFGDLHWNKGQKWQEKAYFLVKG